MKETVAYLCDFCPQAKAKFFRVKNGLFRTEKGAAQHERQCWYNPALKACLSCAHFTKVERVDGEGIHDSYVRCDRYKVALRSFREFDCNGPEPTPPHLTESGDDEYMEFAPFTHDCPGYEQCTEGNEETPLRLTAAVGE